MTDIIEHHGIVENINGSHLKVRIVQTSACAACSAKGHCALADTKEKLITVNTADTLHELRKFRNKLQERISNKTKTEILIFTKQPI